MTTYISILRGINVSGHKLIKMEALKKLYVELKFQNVVSYIQSGNVLFTSKEKDQASLAQLISTGIQKSFGFEVPVLVLSMEQLQRIINNNPYTSPKYNPDFIHLSFLAAPPTDYDWEAILSKKQKEEAIIIAPEVVYLYCPKGYGQTKLHNSFLESKLQVPATTRNWKTANVLLQLASK